MNLKRNTHIFALRGLGLAALCALSCNSHALPSDSEQNLIFEAQEWEFNEGKGTTTYLGAVLMQQGSMKINAEKIVIHGKLDRATRVIATGKPARFQQTPKVGAEPVTATARQLEYQVDKKTLLLLGDAELDQDEIKLSGNRIEYDVNNAIVKAGSTAEGSTDEKRVKMVIPPRVLQSDNE